MPSDANPTLHRPEDAAQEWPGQRLGLPRTGSRSVARAGRRFGAFAIDLALVAIISKAFFGYGQWESLIIFIVLQIVFLSLASGSIGHLILGMRVVPLHSGWIGVWRPAVRSILLSVALPAMIWDADHRGMHDKAAGTILVRR